MTVASMNVFGMNVVSYINRYSQIIIIAPVRHHKDLTFGIPMVGVSFLNPFDEQRINLTFYTDEW
jgi:hypothetical protein